MTNASLGVIVGRFQTDKLHHGHHHLIQTVIDANDDLLIVLGSSQGLASNRYPLSFEARAKMILNNYPNAIVREIFDQPSDYIWSRNLDTIIAKISKQYTDIRLYGSRDSFIGAYNGDYSTIEISPYMNYSASFRRAIIGNNTSDSKEWRRGVIHTIENRIPITYGTVDIAVIRENQVLLGEKKSDSGDLRFIGGFLDKNDISDEYAACRELREEAGDFGISSLTYLGSTRIDDWRYRGTKDGIMTRFFVARHISGRPSPGDDIDALHWVPIDMVKKRLNLAHSPLGEILVKFVHTNPNF